MKKMAKKTKKKTKCFLPYFKHFPVKMALAVAFLAAFLILLKIYLHFYQIYFPPVMVPPVPQGVLKTDKLNLAVNDSLTLWAYKLWPKAGKINYVRYYILNPSLAEGNDWGLPSYCSCGSCTQEDDCPIKTYDLGESSNAQQDYKIIWNYATTLGSAGLVRGLTPTNLLPGKYKIMLQVVDTQGNVNLSASEVEVTLNEASEEFPQVTFDNCLGEIWGNNYSFSWSANLASNFAYKLDNGSFEDLGEQNWVNLSLEEGNHVLTVNAVSEEGQESGEICRFKVN
jgi:hypothetical protein